jgi:hypothetical protein
MENEMVGVPLIGILEKKLDEACGERLPGEGDVKIVRKVRERVPCMECGEPADQRHTYLLPNPRSNPLSSGYRGDDITWRCDHECFTCKTCRDEYWHGRQPKQDGYGWCATFDAKEHFAHMFLRWRETEIGHTSDCAVHNEPAMPAGPCSCRLKGLA